MTIIVCDGVSLAGDSEFGGNYRHSGPQLQKIFQAEDGSVIGCAGEFRHYQQFVDWYNNGAKIEEKWEETIDSFGAYVFKSDGTLWVYGESLHSYKDVIPSAMGTGSTFAMGALLAGADAYEAAQIACKLDRDSGGEVICMKPEHD